ncbi:PKD domain-containing protein [Herbiconiux sp. CPCC 203407]|uniref:PKD domain-containing protein n=1 Tax=Herbiconiux oxytropis TaxID=2970915 RepID=A0AA41XFI7_9MICO|nr:PKD domain-containing protein [Herbiconiux oxytropis]MCS5721950.1 PKD domain-containing protein [Herbiconiux oxytropis]MCS5725533.1 PKD domain-containing protein [Herbiconiux oxytropis]
MKRLSLLASATAAAVVAGSVLGTGGLAASAAAASPVPPAATAGYTAIAPSVPVVDSQLSVGSTLGSDPVQIDVTPGTPTGPAPASALVRLTGLEPAAATAVSASGAEALRLSAGASGSTTVLVPLTGDGSFALQATTPVDVRVETIAVFASAAQLPGSLVALPMPVLRTPQEGPLPLGATGVSIGVVGLGGVPSTDVRGVFVTAAVHGDSTASGTLELGGLALPVRGGDTISTIAFPDADGDISISGPESLSIALTVRGYMGDAPQGPLGEILPANVAGSLVPAPASDPQRVKVSAGAPSPVSTAGLAEAAHALALVWAAGAPERSALTPDTGASGRSNGVLVDGAAGAAPQLVLLGEDSALSTKRGSFTAGAVVVAGILGEATTASDELAVTVTSHGSGDRVDLAETGGVIALEGGLKVDGGTIATVTVRSGDTLIGSAAVRQTPEGTSWSLDTAVPTSGERTFEVVATDRDGTTARTSIDLDVVLPDEGETVIVDDVQILDDPVAIAVTAVTADTVVVVCDLTVGAGDYLVASAIPNAPQGFLRKIVAVDRTATGTVLHTESAVITDVVVQAKADQEFQLGAGETPTAVVEVTEAAAAGVDEIVAGDGLAAWVDDTAVDDTDMVELTDGEEITEGGSAEGDRPAASSLESRSATAGKAVPSVVGGEVSASKTMSSAIKLGYMKESDSTEDSSKTDGKKTKAKVKVEGGFYLEASQSTTATLSISAEVWVTWSWAIPKPHLNFETSFTLSSEVKSEIAIYLEASVSQSLKKFERDIAKYYFPGITVYLGIPVYVSPSVSLALTGSVTATANLQYSMSEKVEKKIGVQCLDGTCTKIDEAPSGTKGDPQIATYDDEVTGGGALDASFGPRFSASALLYGAAGPEVSMSFLLGASVSVEGSSAGTLTAAVEVYVKIAAGLALVVEVPVFNITLLDWTLGEVTYKFVLLKLSKTFGVTPDTDPPVDGGSGGGSSGPVPGEDGGGTVREAIDLMFVIDTTGSMGSYISAAVDNARTIAGKLASTAKSARVGLVEYRDYGDEFIARTVQPLTSDLASLDSALSTLYASGGGDLPEAVYSGVATALTEEWRSSAARAMVVMGDAPSHDPEVHTAFTGAQIAGFLAGTASVCQNGAGNIIGGPALPVCPGTEGLAGEGTGGGVSALSGAVPLAEATGLPVGLYGLSSDGQLTEQLNPLAAASGGTVADISGASEVGDEIIAAIEDASTAPSPHVAWSGAVVPGVATSFDASASLYEGASPVYSFDFGDGTAVVSGSESVVPHVYEAEGEYTITLTVTDERGRASVATATVVVSEAEVAWTEFDVTADRADVVQGEAITVSASGLAPGTVVSFTWAAAEGRYSAVVDAEGLLRLRVTVPPGTPPGALAFRLEAPAVAGFATGSVTVLAAATVCAV